MLPSFEMPDKVREELQTMLGRLRESIQGRSMQKTRVIRKGDVPLLEGFLQRIGTEIDHYVDPVVAVRYNTQHQQFGVRGKPVDHPERPTWHVDHTAGRLVCTVDGPGTLVQQDGAVWSMLPWRWYFIPGTTCTEDPRCRANAPAHSTPMGVDLKKHPDRVFMLAALDHGVRRRETLTFADLFPPTPFPWWLK